MYYIGIKQRGFNPDNLLSENSAHWLTYFNPVSKLKLQTANHWNSAGVKCYSNLNDAIEMMEDIRKFGVIGLFVALIGRGQLQVAIEAEN